MDSYDLMIPGPVEVAPEVLRELALPIVPHYGTEWTRYYKDTVALLQTVFKTNGRVYLLPGSGSAAAEAAIGSAVGDGDRILVLTNGFFGDRLAAIARSYWPDAAVVSLPPTEPFSPKRLEQAIDSNPGVNVVAVVHSESSSGLLNPVEDLARVCRERGLLLVVDAVSSLAGIDLRMDEWGIGICFAASQKCLGAPPGLGLVAVSSSAWEQMEGKKTPGWYLNLHVWREFEEAWGDWHPYPVTLPTSLVRALRVAVEALLAEGLESQFERHRGTCALLRTKLARLGFAPVFDEAIASPTVPAFLGRADLSADRLVAELESRHGLKIAKGMGEYRGKAFRIGNMGAQASVPHVERLTHAIAEVLRAAAPSK